MSVYSFLCTTMHVCVELSVQVFASSANRLCAVAVCRCALSLGSRWDLAHLKVLDLARCNFVPSHLLSALSFLPSMYVCSGICINKCIHTNM
mmetsp:Transcript_40610/g.59789  ORF Transcript_40610/g.59789 Transcript_40610/m.59789 type:complete len:92 (-) Transcript_40610:87-362(-)